ncbi:hypothetical protein [Streptomyces mirabilis]|uniref:hypothetical protein n=1 Tax=Streptomyces mirabilis TaxID=68239 RepID=UPI003BEF4556
MGATADHSVHFHQVHLDDMARVRVRKDRELEEREVTRGEIGKGYEWPRADHGPPPGPAHHDRLGSRGCGYPRQSGSLGRVRVQPCSTATGAGIDHPEALRSRIRTGEP